MMLSANFSLEEMLVSDTAKRMGRVIEADGRIIENLRWGCQNIMQPIRELHGGPIIVTSGYRPPWLNKAIGGSKNSQHMQGCACDFKILARDGRLIDLMRKIVQSDMLYDQLIYETGAWIHVSWNPLADARQQVLTMYRKARPFPLRPKSHYIQGIHEIHDIQGALA